MGHCHSAKYQNPAHISLTFDWHLIWKKSFKKKSLEFFYVEDHVTPV